MTGRNADSVTARVFTFKDVTIKDRASQGAKSRRRFGRLASSLWTRRFTSSAAPTLFRHSKDSVARNSKLMMKAGRHVIHSMINLWLRRMQLRRKSKFQRTGSVIQWQIETITWNHHSLDSRRAMVTMITEATNPVSCTAASSSRTLSRRWCQCTTTSLSQLIAIINHKRIERTKRSNKMIWAAILQTWIWEISRKPTSCKDIKTWSTAWMSWHQSRKKIS